MRSPKLNLRGHASKAWGWPLPYLSGRITLGDGTKSLRESAQGLLDLCLLARQTLP